MEAGSSASQRVRVILRELLNDVDMRLNEIEDIAQEEAMRFPDDSPERQAWTGFAALGYFSDVGVVHREIIQRIVSLRGYMVYRGLLNDVIDEFGRQLHASDGQHEKE